MRKFLGLALLVGGSLVWADDSINLDQWAALLTRTQNKGQHFETDIYAAQSLSRLEPDDKTKPRHLSSFTAGGRMSNDKFIARSTSMVIEDWSLRDGNWHVDQWIYEATLDGELARVGHYLIDESPTGSILHYQPVSLQDVNEDTLRAQFMRELSPWLNGQY